MRPENPSPSIRNHILSILTENEFSNNITHIWRLTCLQRNNQHWFKGHLSISKQKALFYVIFFSYMPQNLWRVVSKMARTQPPEHKASTLSSTRLKSTCLKRTIEFRAGRLCYLLKNSFTCWNLKNVISSLSSWLF